jgi:hypothetical protein
MYAERLNTGPLMPTTADLDDAQLLDRARALLASGKAPISSLSGIWGGAGRNETCSVCGLAIRPDEIGFDLVFRASEGEIELHMHSRCRRAWERAWQAESD